MAILAAITSITSLICWIMTLIKAFQSGNTTNGVLSICPLVGFILGWMNSKAWGHQPVMIAWTIAILASIAINIVMARSLPAM